MKLRCLEGSRTPSNSYVLLSNDGFQSPDDRDASAAEKQEEIFFYNDDGTKTSVVVEKNLRATDLCQILAVKNRVPKDAAWSLIEHWEESGFERIVEDHEDVLAVHRRTEKTERKFVFRKLSHKYDFFTDPQNFFPSDMVDLTHYCSPFSTCSLTIALQQLLSTSDECPSIFSQAWIESQRNVWSKAFLLLKDRKLYMSSKVQVVAKFLRQWTSREGQCYTHLEEDPNRSLEGPSTSRDFVADKVSHEESESLQLLAEVGDYEVYSCLNAKKHLNAPTQYGFCLRPIQHENFASALRLACDSQRDTNCWVTAMRLAKYGKQLRENYRAFKNKQVDSVSPKDYNSYSVPNESVRSRVAMDFTGSVGRIVEDPLEAKAIAVSEGIAWKRRWRGSGCTLRRTVGGTEFHLGQPWFHQSLSRQQATSLISSHGNQDGVFLVRESRSNPGCFVLTFRCSGKVIHMTIEPIVDAVRDAVCYTLDSGVTKFYDLLQLVEFYQLNAGCLPTRLTHYLERAHTSVPIAPTTSP